MFMGNILREENEYMRRSKHFYRMWRYVLIRTLPVLLIPMLLTIYICNVSISRIIENTYESQLQALQSGVTKTERILSNASDLIAYLENESDSKQFLASSGPMENGKSTLDFIDLQNNMHSLIVSNSLFSNIQMYSRRSGALIDSSTISLVPSRYYGRVFQLKDAPFSEWSKEYLDASFSAEVIPAQRCAFNGKEDSYLMIAHSYPTGFSRYSVGNIFIFISEGTLLDNAFDVSAVNDGLLCAMNEQGQIVFRSQSEYAPERVAELSSLTDDHGYVTLSHDGESMLLVYAAGTQHGLRYFALIPTEQALASTIRFRTTIIALMILFVLAGLAMIAFCSARLSRPVSNLYDLVAPSRDAISFDDFSAGVRALISQNENLQEQISQQSARSKMAVFYNLLLGNADGELRSESCRRQMGIERAHGAYVVMTVVLNDFGEYSEENLGIKMYIREALQSKLSEILALCDWGYDKFVLLLGAESSAHEQAEQTVNAEVERLSDELHNGFALSLTFFGDVCDALDEVSIAFHHTLAALQRADKDTSSVVQWHRPAESASAAFVYPIEIESQLIAAALGGNSAMVRRCFEEIQALNPPQPGSPDGVSEDLLLALRSSWLRLCGDPGSGADGETVVTLVDECLRAQGSRLECLTAIRGAFAEAAHAAGKRENAEISENQRQIKEFVDANYANPDMSLILVADAFHISEVYLSKLFKQITGENFSKYIEQLRMQRANQLLRERRAIKDVAIEVGYNSPQVFRRAYKRLYGVSPSDKDFSN